MSDQLSKLKLKCKGKSLEVLASEEWKLESIIKILFREQMSLIEKLASKNDEILNFQNQFVVVHQAKLEREVKERIHNDK